MSLFTIKIQAIALLLFVGISIRVNAQDIPELIQKDVTAINLESVLKLGGANSLTIQKYKQKEILALTNVAKAQEWWLPSFYAGTSFHQLWGNAMNAPGEILTDINRQNFGVGLGINAQWDFGDGVFKVDAAELKVKAAEYKTQAEQNKAILQIINTYYDFLAAQLYYSAYQELVVGVDTIIVQIQTQVEADLRYESELLLAKSNLNHLKVEMLNAKIQFDSKSVELVKLLNLDPSTSLVAADAFLAPLELVDVNNNIVMGDAVYESRPDFLYLEQLMLSTQAEKKTTTKGLWLPELRVGTHGSYFGGVFSPLNPTGIINAGLIWEVPLGRLAKKGSLKQFDAQIALQETDMELNKAEINAEIVNSRNLIQTIQRQTKLAEEGSKLAEEALKQSIARQELRTVLPVEIVQAQEIYIKSKLDYLKSVASYNKAQYAYFVATGNNL